jgi:hypothetical protein
MKAMTPIPNNIVEAAIQIIGTSGIEDEAIESRVRELVSDEMTARRLIDWIPEAFGLVLISHISSKIILPTTFSAKASDGHWVTLKFEAEPIFTVALQMAQSIYQNGPGEVFKNISLRSAMTDSVNRALNSGRSLDGASLSGPALIGIPAEVYSDTPKSFWQKIFSR